MDPRPDAAPPPDYDPLSQEEIYPFQTLMGFDVTGWAEGWARVEMDLAEAHLNRHGIPHGGVHAALLDTVMGYAGSFCPFPGRTRRAMTLSLTVNYVGQARGRRLIAEGRQTGGGRKSFFVSGELRDELGTLVATASSTMRWRGEGGDLRGDPA